MKLNRTLRCLARFHGRSGRPDPGIAELQLGILNSAPTHPVHHYRENPMPAPVTWAGNELVLQSGVGHY